MGVSGVGKSTVARLLSEELSIPYFDGDDFHSETNIKKMSSGHSLNDNDRHDWLVTLNDLVKKQSIKQGCIIACSALKQAYRDILTRGTEGNVSWIHLSGSFEQISDRMNSRSDHFMPSVLLKSQFAILENPTNALQIDISLPPKDIVKIIKNEFVDKSEFGLFGLGVMGKSLCRNLSKNGFKISMYNRHVRSIEEHVAQNFKDKFPELSNAVAFDDIPLFINSLQRPRKIMLMVTSGEIVDSVIEDLLPYLSENDILIDGGNSNYIKTNKRFEYLKAKNIHFIGAGISGGEEGALKGPSIMPSGTLEAYKSIQPFLETISAKDKNNRACCSYVGPEGSGHFVKMVHNGIEYVEMQLLAEVCNILESFGKDFDEIATILETWKGTANSYLLEITIDILRKKEDGDWLVKKVLDKAGNKGTGNWTTIASTQLGVPSTLIASALFARYVSFYKEERIQLNKNFRNSNNKALNIAINDVLEAYQFARIINHYQGFKLISQASTSYSWDLDLSEIARIWTNGCIIKSSLMEDLVDVLIKTKNILTNPQIVTWIKQFKPAANKVVSQCVLHEVSAPCLGDAIHFFNGITTENSSANIIQAQRDYFGAHTYQRVDDDFGKNYHSNWKDN